MNPSPRWPTLALALTAALTLGACSVQVTHTDPKGPPGGGDAPLSALQTLQVQDQNRNGILDQDEKLQTVKTCSGGLCEVTVNPAPQVVPGRTGGFDCGIRLSDDVLLINRQVNRLAWQIVEPANASVDYRFAPAVAGSKTPSGISLYADPDRRVFSVEQAQGQRFLLVPQLRQQAGYAYGVYLQWKKKGDSDRAWRACNPLDPIIIELN